MTRMCSPSSARLGVGGLSHQCTHAHTLVDRLFYLSDTSECEDGASSETEGTVDGQQGVAKEVQINLMQLKHLKIHTVVFISTSQKAQYSIFKTIVQVLF